MKDLIIALLLKDAIGFGLSLFLAIVVAASLLGGDKIARWKRERRRQAMLELKRDLRRIAK